MSATFGRRSWVIFVLIAVPFLWAIIRRDFVPIGFALAALAGAAVGGVSGARIPGMRVIAGTLLVLAGLVGLIFGLDHLLPVSVFGLAIAAVVWLAGRTHRRDLAWKSWPLTIAILITSLVLLTALLSTVYGVAVEGQLVKIVNRHTGCYFLFSSFVYSGRFCP
jgi:hypothetical protein